MYTIRESFMISDMQSRKAGSHTDYCGIRGMCRIYLQTNYITIYDNNL